MSNDRVSVFAELKLQNASAPIAVIPTHSRFGRHAN